MNEFYPAPNPILIALFWLVLNITATPPVSYLWLVFLTWVFHYIDTALAVPR